MVFRKQVSRRDFLKLTAGSTAALGLLLFKFPDFEKALAASVAEIPVIWLQGGSCSGCSVSVLNSLSPKIQDILVSQLIPDNHISLRVHPTIMAGQGDQVLEAIENTSREKGGYVLVMEGSIPTKDDGIYCEFGERNGHGITILEHLTTLGADAMAVIAIGSCSSFGGIPAAAPNTTGCKSVQTIFNEKGIDTPVINLPGCPPHPDWFVGTLASVLMGGLESVEVDELGRPVAFYGKLIHDNCPRRGYFDAGIFAKNYSEPYCLFQLGCKGPVTYADCPVRLWNSGTNWCVGSNGPCIGCCNPGFPDDVSPLRKVSELIGLTPPSWLPPVEEIGQQTEGLSPGLAAGLGAVGGLAVGAAGIAIANRKSKSSEETEE